MVSIILSIIWVVFQSIYFGGRSIDMLSEGLENQKSDVQEQMINVYPNPNSGQFAITSDVAQENTTAIIYNALGEEVYKQKVAQQTEIINTDLSNGVYLLRVLNDKGIKTQKIIINR